MEPPPCPTHWRIAGAVLVSDGIGGKVWRTERADDGPVALKQTSPAALSEIDGAAGFLRWADGDGAVRLLGRAGDLRPLHGDVHHANILSSPRGWLAIDPKGLIGEPAFDAANLFCNPLEKYLRFREDRALSMAAILSPALGCAAERLLDHAFAFSALSAAWHLEDGNPGEAERSLAVGRAVRVARARLTS